MRVKIHRGANEIGGNCIELESLGSRILLDIGLPIEENLDDNMIKNFIKQLDGMDGASPELDAILISHPHLDHYGLLKYMNPNIPIAIGRSAYNTINAASHFQKDKWKVPNLSFILENNKTIEIGNFKITPYLVCHSAFDAYALMVEADGKTLFYSGDFRFHGRKASLMQKLISNPPSPIDLLIMEGTNVSGSAKQKETKTETDLVDDFYREILSSQGLTLIQTSSQNIDRIVTIYKATRKAKKSLVIDLYTAMVLDATGTKSIPRSFWEGIELFLPHWQRKQVINQNLFSKLRQYAKNRIYLDELSKNPAGRVMLFRPSMVGDLKKDKTILDGVKFIYSLWEGYWNRDSNARFRTWLEENKIHKISIHTSGHVNPQDWIEFGKKMNPKTIIPIHTQNKHQYKETFANVVDYTEGEWHEI